MKRRGKATSARPLRNIKEAGVKSSFSTRTAAKGQAARAGSQKNSARDRDLLLHEQAADWLVSRWEDRRPAVLQKRKSRMPGWLWPLLALTAILLAVFLFLPAIIDRSVQDHNHHLDEEAVRQASTYGDDVRVVTAPVADLLEKADITSGRVDQVLYNTPVQLLQEGVGEQQAFCEVRLQTGQTGYLSQRSLTADRQSIEPTLYREKLIVTDLTKRIMSHADSGTLLEEVKRGTVLYVLYDGKDLFRVQLPAGGEGWLSAGGIAILPVQSSLPLTDANHFVASALTYDKTRWIPHGKTDEGIDIYGVISQAAAVNGLDLPSGYDPLYEMGETVETAFTNTGDLNEQSLQPGDIFFCERIKTYDDDGTPVIDPEKKKLAIWMGEDQFLTESVREFAITRHEADVLLKNWQVVRVARYFPTLGR